MTTPTPAAQVGIMPRLRELADASRRAIQLQLEREQAEREARERSQAVDEATHTLKDRFPGTLGKLKAESRLVFTGYPTVYDDLGGSIPPCAVAYLGEGVFLHHTQVPDPRPMRRGWPTLLIPCVCGRYREVPIEDDYTLATELENTATNGDVCLGTCTPAGGRRDDDGEDW